MSLQFSNNCPFPWDCSCGCSFLHIWLCTSTSFFCFFFSSRLTPLNRLALSCSGERAGANERDLSCAASKTAPLLLRDKMTLQCHTAPGLPQSQLALSHSRLMQWHCVIKIRGCQLSESSPGSFSADCRRRKQKE